MGTVDLEMNVFVQWLVVLGIWWCLFIDVLGNQAGQQDTANAANWKPIVVGTAAVGLFVHGAAVGRLVKESR